MMMPPWDHECLMEALSQSPHRSAEEHTEFLWEEAICGDDLERALDTAAILIPIGAGRVPAEPTGGSSTARRQALDHLQLLLLWS